MTIALLLVREKRKKRGKRRRKRGRY